MGLTRSYEHLNETSKKGASHVKATYSKTMPFFLKMFKRAVSECHSEIASQIAIDDSGVEIPADKTGELSYSTLDQITTILAKQIRENLSKNAHGTGLRASITGLKHQSIPKDGHCLFNAVALYTGEAQEYLRSIVASHIEHDIKHNNDKNEYQNKIKAINPNKTVKKYLKDLRQGIEWADNLEIAVLMKLLNRPIVIVGPDGKVRNKSDLIGKGDPIFVYYNGSNHYDALILTGEKNPKQIFEDFSQLNEPSSSIQSLVDADNNLPRIGVYMPHSALPVICLLAIWKAGCVYVPLSQESHTTLRRLLQIVEDCNISLLLTHPSCYSHYFIGHLKYLYNAKRSLPILGVSRKDLISQISSDQPVYSELGDLKPDQLAYIIYSSGTTGTPKGIAINHGGLWAPTVAHHETLEIKKGMKIALYSDVAFDPFVMEVMTALGVSDHGGGGTLYIVPTAAKQDPNEIGFFYQKNKIQAAVFTPSMLDLLQPEQFDALECVISMGEKLPKEIFEKWKGKKPKLIFVNGYGPTEVTICSSLGKCDKDNWSAGKVIDGLKGFILSSQIDQDYREEKKLSDKSVLTSDEVSDKLFIVQDAEKEGELFIQGVGVGRYWGKQHEQRNKKRFFEELYVQDEDKKIYCLHNVYRTGDLVKYVNGKNLEIIRRIDREIKLNDGRRYDVEPFETSLSKLPEVKSVQIGSLENKFLVAVIRTKEKFETTLHEFIEKSWASITSNLVSGLLINPSTETIVGSSNKLDIDKIIKKNEEEIHKRQGVTFNEPAPKELSEDKSLQDKLAEIWSEILSVKKENLTPQSHFFQLGGHSMLAYQLVSKLKNDAETKISKGAKSLSADEIIHYPTLAALTRRLKIKKIAENLMQTLQNGNKKVMPLFLIPSITGDGILDYKGKAEKWVSENTPVYTFRAAGLDDNRLIAETIREMADHYLISVVSKLQENNKKRCFILGYSSGGAIAYEMAIQLQEKNIQAEVILLDSRSSVYLQQISPTDHLNYLCELEFAQKVWKYAFGKGIISEYYKQLGELSNISQVEKIFENLFKKANEEKNKEAATRLKVMRSIALSHYTYIPRKYLENAILVKAEGGLKADPELPYMKKVSFGWPLSREIIPVPNVDHFSILANDKTKDLLTPLLKVKNPIDLIKNYYLQQRKIDGVASTFDPDIYQATHISSGEKDEDGTEKRLSVKDLFKLDNNGNLPRKRISIVSHAGTGKSIFCQYLVYNWAVQKLWQNEFDIIVYVSLKNLMSYSNEEGTISNVIHKEYLSRICSLQEVKTFLTKFQKDRKKILYLLDGFDKVSDLACESPDKATPQGNLIRVLLKQEQVIITSRPYCIEKYISSQWKPEPLVQELEISGFAKKDIDSYIEHFFKKNKNDKVKAYIDSLQSLLLKNANIYELTLTPVVLDLICNILASQDLADTKDIKTTQVYKYILQELCLRYLDKLGIQYDDNLKKDILNNSQCEPEIHFMSQSAYELMKEDTLVISKERLLDFSEEFREHITHFGLIAMNNKYQLRSEPEYYFNPMFQKFLAAYYITKNKFNFDFEVDTNANKLNVSKGWRDIYKFVVELIDDKSLLKKLVIKLIDVVKNQQSFAAFCIDILIKEKIQLDKDEIVKIILCLDQSLKSDITWKQIKDCYYGFYNYIKDLEIDNDAVSKWKEWIVAEKEVSRLHLAAEEGNISDIKKCIEGGEVNQVDYHGRTPLYVAVVNNQSKAVKVLLEAKADPNLATKLGTTPLLISCSFKAHIEIVKDLLEYGAKINVSDNVGITPLHNAAYYGLNDVVALLLKHKEVNIKAKDSEGRTPLHHTTYYEGQCDVAAQLLKYDNEVGHMKDNAGNTPLHHAAYEGQCDVAVQLLDKVVDSSVNIVDADNTQKIVINIAHTKNSHGCIPVHYAAAFGKKDMVALLLKYNKVHVKAEDNHRKTPLHYAASGGQSSVVSLLLDCDGVDVNAKDDQGCTPLHCAVIERQDKIVALLLQCNEVDVDAKDVQDRTPLHHAVINGQDNMVALILVKRNEVNVDAEDNQGYTPLHYAVEKGQSNVVTRLLEKTKNVNVKDKIGQTPLHLAASKGHSNLVTQLLVHMEVAVNVKDNNGSTPLHVAIINGQSNVVALMLNKVTINAKDNNCQTPLHVAADHGHAGLVKLLLNHIHEKVEVNDKDKDGYTPLHLAAIYGHSEVGNLLLAYKHEKVLIDAEDEIGCTPLHRAALNGQSNMVTLLVNKVKDVNAKNIHGNTPLHLAAREGHSNVVEVLLNDKSKNFNIVDVSAANGDTSLHLAARGGHSKVVALLLEVDKNPNATNIQKETPLHVAISNGKSSVVETLIKHSKVIIYSDYWYKPKGLLHYAIEKGKIDEAVCLLKHGHAKVDVNEVEAETTALYYAVNHGQSGFVKLLIAYGAELTYSSKVTQSFKRVIKSLEEKVANEKKMTEISVLLKKFRKNPSIKDEWKREIEASQQVSTNDAQIIANNPNKFFSSSTSSSTEPLNNSQGPRPS